MRRGKIVGEEGGGRENNASSMDGEIGFVGTSVGLRKNVPWVCAKLVLKGNSAPRIVVRVRKNDVSGDG